MEPSSYSGIIRRLRELAPFLDDTSAKAALSAFVGALGAMLTRDEQTTLASALPAEVAQILREEEPWAQNDTPNVFRMVASRRNVPVSQAIEQTIVVCRVLSEILAPSVRARLIRSLPPLGRLLQPTEDFGAPAPYGERTERPHDLAEGRPGSEHALASSNLERLAHEHSVARSDDPHADTKLSSTRGLTQEREAQTLATGRPGSGHPLSESH